MSFLWPIALSGLITLPILIGLYVWLGRRRSVQPTEATLGAGYGDARTLGWKRHIAPLLSLVAIGSLLVGFARPQATIDVPELRSTVILIFDTSQSMIADDIEPSALEGAAIEEPTRLDAAKAAAAKFVEGQPDSVEIGIVSFGTTGAVTLRPSDDRAAVLASIDRLQAAGGTSLTEGLFAGLSALAQGPIFYQPDADGSVTIPPVDFGGFGSAIVVLFSDGEDLTEQNPAPLAELAASNGIRIHAVGVGTPEGAVVEVDGFSLSTALNEESLQDLALLSNGTYFSADSIDELSAVTDSIEKDLTLNEENLEITSFFGIAALALLAVAALVSMAMKGKMP